MDRRKFLTLGSTAVAVAALPRWLYPTPRPGLQVDSPRPPHHDPAGGFRNPWPTADSDERGGFLKWQMQRLGSSLPPNPRPEDLPLAAPRIAYPRAPEDELRITWVGHASFLIQIGGANVLTDPQWSRRASPFSFMGPARFVPPAVPWEDLPPIDAVLISHDHYDHLDDRTVRRLHERFGDDVQWFVPLEHRSWLGSRGIRRVAEMDWWDEAPLDIPTRGRASAGDGRSAQQPPAGTLRVVALPCQHWTSRTPFDRQSKLWASWAVVAPEGRSVYFGGDSGYFPDYPLIRERIGTFDALMLPIGAYEPRWFMKPMHMNPEEAVQTYIDLGASGILLPMHWGTFRLTDEDPLEPPHRTEAAWRMAGLPEEDLRILQHGGTWVM
jgi:N-acyl-phosphatidylethanolamine-hydrolysing phospholipase D